jgi:dTDP-4-amino-4,6-dideoxygalactose transaminase
MTWPVYDEQQIEDVVAILRSGKVNAWTGPHVRNFEEAYETYLGRRHAIALANGSVALDLALHVLELQAGDEVIVTPRSFVASAACVPLAGGVPVFAEIDRDSQNITAETISEKITDRTRAIIAVHLAGWPCEMDEIMQLARQHDIVVIEDCAQAHGAELNGKPVGSFGHMACFSFCQDKIITTGGEGGLLAMDDEDLWKRAWSYKDHGKSHDAVFKADAPPGFRWLHESFGTNLRMTAIQAAIGQRQLKRLAEWTRIRTTNADILRNALADAPCLRTPATKQHAKHAWYRFYTFVRPEKLKPDWSRARIIEETGARGVPCFSGSCSEIYLEKAFVDAGLSVSERLPVARELGETSLAYLVSPSIDAESMTEQARMARQVIDLACA